MKLIKLFFYIITANTLFIGCEEPPPPNISQQAMIGMARGGDPEMHILVGNLTAALVDCKKYRPKCKIGYRVVIKKLSLDALYYETQEDALASANHIQQYLSRNWVFDNVVGEPILERFVVKHLFAKRIK